MREARLGLLRNGPAQFDGQRRAGLESTPWEGKGQAERGDRLLQAGWRDVLDLWLGLLGVSGGGRRGGAVLGDIGSRGLLGGLSLRDGLKQS